MWSAAPSQAEILVVVAKPKERVGLNGALDLHEGKNLTSEEATDGILYKTFDRRCMCVVLDHEWSPTFAGRCSAALRAALHETRPSLVLSVGTSGKARDGEEVGSVMFVDGSRVLRTGADGKVVVDTEPVKHMAAAKHTVDNREAAGLLKKHFPDAIPDKGSSGVTVVLKRTDRIDEKQTREHRYSFTADEVRTFEEHRTFWDEWADFTYPVDCVEMEFGKIIEEVAFTRNHWGQQLQVIPGVRVITDSGDQTQRKTNEEKFLPFVGSIVKEYITLVLKERLQELTGRLRVLEEHRQPNWTDVGCAMVGGGVLGFLVAKWLYGD